MLDQEKNNSVIFDYCQSFLLYAVVRIKKRKKRVTFFNYCVRIKDLNRLLPETNHKIPVKMHYTNHFSGVFFKPSAF